MTAFTMLSLFSGSGGFELAGVLCDIRPVACAEVEPYPVAVTRSRFPNMKHLGDVSKVNGGEIEPVDVLTFGSPCQSFSVAGKRDGLKHAALGDEETTRSGLFMEAIRIIKEMREATNGRYPTFAVLENVPGIFSSGKPKKGEDFRTVLQSLIQIVEPGAVMPDVPKNGWSYADWYMGEGWSLAYRVLDAQFWGVPQRRRRIYLVLDLRGERAGKILFERDRLRRNYQTCGAAWEKAAGDAEGGTGADDRAVMEAKPVAFSFDSLASNSMKSSNPHSGCRQVEVAKTLDTTDPNPSKNQGGIAVVEQQPVYCLQGGGATSQNSQGMGHKEDISYTLNTTDIHAVAFQTYQKVTGPLMANSHPGSYTGQDAFSDMLVAGKEHRPVVRYIVRRLTPTECARLQGFPDKWGHPDHKDSLTDEEYAFWLDVRNTHAAINGKVVKDYTREQMLSWYNKLHTDSSEYKMWGNGIALPCALYVMQGIEDALKEEIAWIS